MQRFMTLLLGVWREACQHIEIGESAARIMPLVNRRLPIDLLLVRRIDLRRSCVDTVGTGMADAAPPAQTRTPCSPEQLERLLAWCRRGEVLRLSQEAPSETRSPFLPKGVEAEALVGPLCSDNGPMGLLILVAAPVQEVVTVCSIRSPWLSTTTAVFAR